MKKVLNNYGGILFFYLFIVLSIIFINARFNYFDKGNADSYSYAYKN